MLDIINRQDLQKYEVSFAAGETLFLQGDNSQDMYLLVSGKIEVFKDDKKIADITEPGTTVGEMSFLLETRRTATVKALTDVKAIMIPRDQITDFMHDHPGLVLHIALKLARRLEETTRIMHALREFSDQLPDAIIMADKGRNILSWNQAAEKLHGRTWREMKGYPLADLYQDLRAYEQFVEDVQSGNSLREKELAVKHPDGNTRFVSTSTTVLYDGHHNIEGFIFISRDVTKSKDLEKRYKRIKRWLLPAIIFFCLAIIVALFITIPYFSRGGKILDYKKEVFENRIVRDTENITKAFTDPLAAGNIAAVTGIMKSFFDNEAPERFGIKGIILLDRDKKVITAYSSNMGDAVAAIVGSSYSGIKFRGDETSDYKLLSLFRADREHPMGAEGVEIAYEIRQENGEVANWLIFQLEMEHLDREYGIDTKILSRIKFQKDRHSGKR